LVSAGGLKRVAVAKCTNNSEIGSANMKELEKNVLIQGACNNVVPKLVAEDLPLFESLLKAIFPGSKITELEVSEKRKEKPQI